MTIRRLWLIILILVAIVSVSINAVVLSVLTDRYFNVYHAENYERHFSEIVQYTQSTLPNKDLSLSQMAMELETHLDDPIIRIKLYGAQGNLLIDTDDNHMMMGRGMMDMMRPQYDEADSEVDSVQLYDGDTLIGQLNITRYSALEDSIVARRFKTSLFLNSLYSIAIVLIIALVIGIFISKKMSKDLTTTAKMAHDINVGADTGTVDTNINEIRTIQQSLVALKNKLKLKSKSRKVLIDELVHQTRTPLTVLKTHLEGLSDNVIEMTSEEINVFESQIDNITAIISNMSNMIDTEGDFDTLQIEEFEITSLLKQITKGMRAQFDKKRIDLHFEAKQKVVMRTDKYKLSQIIYNLLTNAYKYTGERGVVNLSYLAMHEAIAIIVEDNGVGIKQEDLTHIFDAYYRSDSNVSSQGEGLGLYLVKQNAEQMNGEIKVHSVVSQGSIFTLTIPLILTEEFER